MDVAPELRRQLETHGQEHVLRWWDELDDAGREQLAAQIASCDLDLVAKLTRAGEESAESHADVARQARPPHEVIRLDDGAIESVTRDEARSRGEAMLAAGKVAALVVAGGQGTRLGFSHAKGLFPIGPVSGAVLLDFLCGQVRARMRRHGAGIPYYVMTSDATHDEMVSAFAAHDSFGLDPDDVTFFRQGHLPAVDAATGKLLLAERGSLALSPDGHGGVIAAMARNGVFEDLRRRGIETIYYHQVDNPCAVVCDPEFLGFHAATGSEMSTKVVAKREAGEKMGVLVDVAGRTQIVEYSDMPADVSSQTEPDGSLRLWAGNTAIHAVSVAFLERIADSADGLPFHRAHKAVPYVDEEGMRVEPASPNALKFERFIFDALPLAKVALVMETDRAREFNPVKNKEGNDSAETCRAALQRMWKDWLRGASVSFEESAAVEILPTFALDADDVRRRLPAGTRLEGSEIRLAEGD